MIKNLPLYHKLSMIVVGIFIFFYILFLGSDIIVPLTFAWILAILLNPVVNYLIRKGCNHILAIVIAILILMIIAAGLCIFIGAQVSMFSDSLPQLKQKCHELMGQGLNWFSHTFHISTPKITKWIEEQKSKGMEGAGSVISTTLGTVSSFFVVLLLIPVYIFLFLFYKPLLLQFIAKLFSKEQHGTVSEILLELKGLIQSYLMGLMIEMAIVATLNSIALLIIGIKYAILFGVIGAILNLIPYIGGVVAIGLPMIMALIGEKPITALYVLGAYIFIQIVDNNFLVPKIVASKVKVNALVSIIVVLVGGAIWGVAGMFLSIPLTAIAKVIFDRIESLEPYGFLIGDTMPPIGKAIFKFNLAKKDPDHLKKTVIKDKN